MKAFLYCTVFLLGLFAFPMYSQASVHPIEQPLPILAEHPLTNCLLLDMELRSVLFTEERNSETFAREQKSSVADLPVAGYTTGFSVAQAVQVNSYTICEGSSVQLTAPPGGHRYLWAPATGLSDKHIANPIASPTQTTVYTAKVFDVNWNTTEYTYIVNVKATPRAYAGEDVSICAGRGDSVQLNASGGVSYSWSPSTGLNSTTIANPVARPTTTTTYTVTVTNLGGCQATDQVTIYVTPSRLDVKVFLQGPFHRPTASMFTHLQDQGILPNQSPYGGTETLGSGLPAHSIVDWILVELRIDTVSTVFTKAGLLRSDGHIVDADGSPFSLTGVPNLSDSYYIVLRHRNHVHIMSAVPVFIGGQCLMTYDFTPSQSAANSSFQLPLIQVKLNPLVFAMAAGDENSDGIINATDRVNVRNASGLMGYRSADLSLDGTVNATDRVLVRNNTFKASQVP